MTKKVIDTDDFVLFSEDEVKALDDRKVHLTICRFASAP